MMQGVSRWSGPIPVANFCTRIADAAGRFPDRPAIELFSDGRVIETSYAALMNSAARGAAWLRQNGCAPGDRVAIMTFHGSSRLVAPFTSDLAAVQRSIFDDIIGDKFGGGTRLLAGVDDAARYFLEQPAEHRRRAVLILTDNYGQRSRRSSTVVRRLWEADALLSGLIVRTGADTARAPAPT